MPKDTSIARIAAAFRFFKDNPFGRLSTGLYEDPTWTREEFRRWFRKCLHTKISRDTVLSGRKLQSEYQAILRRDARTVNDAAKRIIHPGRNILAIPELKRRYPHVDNPPND